jgi:hypothetical protein
MRRSETIRTRAANWQTGRTWGGTLETVGHTQDLTVEGSANIGTISNKALNKHRGRRRHRLDRGPAEKEGAWRMPKPPG